MKLLQFTAKARSFHLYFSQIDLWTIQLTQQNSQTHIRYPDSYQNFQKTQSMILKTLSTYFPNNPLFKIPLFSKVEKKKTVKKKITWAACGVQPIRVWWCAAPGQGQYRCPRSGSYPPSLPRRGRRGPRPRSLLDFPTCWNQWIHPGRSSILDRPAVVCLRGRRYLQTQSTVTCEDHNYLSHRMLCVPHVYLQVPGVHGLPMVNMKRVFSLLYVKRQGPLAEQACIDTDFVRYKLGLCFLVPWEFKWFDIIGAKISERLRLN